MVPKAMAARRNEEIRPCSPLFMTENKGKKRKMQEVSTPRVKVQAKPKPAFSPQIPPMSVPIPKASIARPQTVAMGNDPEMWWITKSLRLEDDRRNGWVVAWIVESHFKEDLISAASGKEKFGTRMANAGMASLITEADGPRKRVQVLAKATEQRDMLFEELGQRRKVDAIAGSY